MNGNSDPNFNEAGTTGAYTGASAESTASAHGYAAGQPGAYNAEGQYAATGAANSNTSAYPGGDAYTAPGYPPPPPGYVPPYGAQVPPASVPGSPNPGLAALLGFIPGVGAMYNGQFAKGVAHIIIFAVLTKIADRVDIFGLFVAGWVFYMVFDAYQTARARRDGLIVPDPFGLNNIGERFGMTSNPNWGDFVARPPAGSNAAPADSARVSNPYAGPPYNTQSSTPYGAPYASPVDPITGAPIPGAGPSGYSVPSGYAVPPAGYGSVPPAGAAYAPPTAYPGSVPPAWQQGYVDPAQAASYPAGVPYAASYAPADPNAMPPYPVKPSSGIPTGAFWLIGLGVLALIGSIGHNVYWTGRYFGGLIPILFGIFLIVQRALTAKNVYPVGSAAHSWYILHQARLGVVLIVVGGLTLLSSLGVVYWNHSWPYLLIVAGLMQVADRAAYNRMLAEGPLPSMPRYDATPQTPAETAEPRPAETASNSGITSIFGREDR